jgi:hypothetical protein
VKMDPGGCAARQGPMRPIENRHSPDERPICPLSSNIVQESIEKCEAVHT